ncbi:Peptidase A1 domain-containing protein [Aphelenchoides bicaudatus]|nr:Peptidase A1 domain-containing protein [Aphelenchoides bicaudatus]
MKQRAKPIKSAKHSLEMHDLYGANLIGKEDSLAYEVKISLGEKMQPISVSVSTSFSGLWVPQRGCANKGENSRYCPAQGAYDPNESRTSRKVKNGFKRNRVQTGSYRQDSFAFGTTKCNNLLKLNTPVVFGAASQTVHGDTGELGLGLPNPSVDGPLTSDQLLDAPIFTTSYKKCSDSGCKKAGILTFGGVDENACEAVTEWIQVPDSAKQWAVNVDRWTLNNFKYNRVSTTPPTILDPTQPNIQVPDATYNAFARQTGAQFSNNEYTVECDKEWKLELQIGEQTFEIGHDKLTKETENGRCKLLIEKSNKWLLGSPFSQTYCIAHNFEKREVGFSKIK